MDIYRQLLRLWNCNAVLAVTKDVTLGGQLAKFCGPGKDIVIEPGNYESLWRWLGTCPPTSLVEELARYLNPSGRRAGDDRGAELEARTPPYAAEGVRMICRSPPGLESVCDLVSVMEELDRRLQDSETC